MSRGLVFDLQRYAVHDGPGIRTLVFLKGCPLRCAWCCNPESQKAEPESLRRHGALETVGREMDAQEVLDEIARDRDFYRNSGGGATFSGGEPFFQPEFLRALLEGCRGRGIHAAVETCGHAQTDIILALEPLVDLFLFDLKVLDKEDHLHWTGRDNGLILDNFKSLAGRCQDKLTPRLTVVPGISDCRQNLSDLAELLRGSRLRDIELLEYHPLGSDKWEALGREPFCQPDPALSGRALVEAARYLSQQGITCCVP